MDLTALAWVSQIFARNSRLTWRKMRGDTCLGIVEFPSLLGGMWRLGFSGTRLDKYRGLSLNVLLNVLRAVQ